MIPLSDLSPKQRAVYDAVRAWALEGRLVPGQRDQRLLTLGGLAGTGKTTLLALLAAELGGRAAFAAYTGKAVCVLREKLRAAGVVGLPQRSVATLHSLLYLPVELPGGRVHFEPRATLRPPDPEAPWGDDNRYSLVVVDEASMVPREMYDLLCGHGVPVLAVGDHGQLPPVFGDFNLMADPLLKLEEVHRQAQGSPVLRIAHAARNLGEVDARQEDGERVRFVRDDAGMDAMLEEFYGGEPSEKALSERVIVCHTNRVRVMLNDHVRKIRWGASADPMPLWGDQLVCLRNAWEEGVYNGLRGFQVRGSSVRRGADQVRVRFKDDAEGPEVVLDVSRHQFGQPKTFQEFEELRRHMSRTPRSWGEVGLLFDYGYALTVHKYQGAEARDVAVVLPRGGMEHSQWRRWAYTAFTRARERLWVVVA